jgi:hypothetical protein
MVTLVDYEVYEIFYTKSVHIVLRTGHILTYLFVN